MRSILKLTWANIKHGKGSFKGIAFLMMLITFSFSGTVSNNDRLEEARIKKYEKALMPDLTVVIYDDYLTDDMLQSVNANENVTDMRKDDILAFSCAPLSDGEEISIKLSAERFTDNTDVFNEDLNGYISGFQLNDGEILLPSKLSMVNGMEKGKELTLKTRNGYDEKFRIKGYYEDVFSGSTTSGDNRCLITGHDLDRLKQDKADSVLSDERYVVLLERLSIDIKECADATEVRRELGKSSALISSSNGAMTKDMHTDSLKMYSNVGTRTVFIFVGLLLTVVLITMYNSIRASIEMDYTKLGILKAQGFTTMQMSMVYVLQYTLALFIGSVLGILASIPACRYLIGLWKNITGLMSETGVSFLKCTGLCAGIIALCIVFIFISTSKIASISPVRAISGGGSEVHFDSRLNVKIRQRPMMFFLALRQLNSRRRSYIGTALIVSLLVFFIISIMILTRGLDADELFTDTTGEITITDTGKFDLNNVDEVEKDIQEEDSGAVINSESYHRMLVEGEHTAVHAYRTVEDVFDPLEGRTPRYDNEIMITEFVSERSDKKIGDSVEVSYKGITKEFVVTGYFQTIWEFGEAVLITPEAMNEMGYSNINEAYVAVSDESKVQAVIERLNEKYGDILKAEEYTENSTVTTYKKIVNIMMDSLTYAMDVILISFAAVVVGMVCKRSFIRERRDIGIFKATGFITKILRVQFALRFALIAFIGSALGSVLSMMWSRKVITYILRIVGLTDFTTEYPPVIFILPAAMICVCFFLTAYISSRRIKTVEVRELIIE